jgi:hypothetical protein
MKDKSLFFSLLTIVLIKGLFLISSCDFDGTPDPDPNNASNPGNGGQLDADIASTYLILNNASKILGDLPISPDGRFKISIKDTIFMVKGLSFGARVVVKHNGLTNITGFYVGVSNSSFYYDVPITESQDRDSTVVIYINFGIPAGVQVDYPLSIPIKIQPHDASGKPGDEFDVIGTIEDPKDKDVCSPLTPEPKCFYDSNNKLVCPCESGCWYWIWEFTVVEDKSGDIHTAYAPGIH